VARIDRRRAAPGTHGEYTGGHARRPATATEAPTAVEGATVVGDPTATASALRVHPQPRPRRRPPLRRPDPGPRAWAQRRRWPCWPSLPCCLRRRDLDNFCLL